MDRPRNTVPSARTRAAGASAVTANSRKGGRKKAGGAYTALPARLEKKIIRLLQAEHITHVVEAGAFAAQEARRAQGAQRVGHATLRADGDFDALTRAREDHRVLADDVAAADGVEADLLGR